MATAEGGSSRVTPPDAGDVIEIDKKLVGAPQKETNLLETHSTHTRAVPRATSKHTFMSARQATLMPL